LAQIWSDVLKLDKVGIHDNFLISEAIHFLPHKLFHESVTGISDRHYPTCLVEKPTVEE